MDLSQAITLECGDPLVVVTPPDDLGNPHWRMVRLPMVGHRFEFGALDSDGTIWDNNRAAALRCWPLDMVELDVERLLSDDALDQMFA